MYVPAHFDASDVGFCHDVIRAHPFASITTGAPGGDLLASHLPFLLDADRGPRGTLTAHVARANPHHDELARGAVALVMFTGPHAYVSPTWYEAQPAVPTWNYCVVHAYGVARFLDEPATVRYLSRLASQFETAAVSPWRFEALPADYRTKMMRGIVAFEIEIGRLQGKAKLSQNRSDIDVKQVIEALEASAAPGDVDLSRWMRRPR